jgi:hypothetical protein
MSSEPHIIIAFLYKRSGKPILTESDIYLSLSMDLGWMPTTEAKAFVRTAIDTDLLTPRDDGLAPTFDIRTIEIPRGFIPSAQASEKEPKTRNAQTGLLDRIIQKISLESKTPASAVTNEVTVLAEEKCVTPDVAALWVARHHDCDVSEFYGAVESQLIP